MRLRTYQTELKQAVLQSVNDGKNPVAQLDTGGGKTPIIAELCKELQPFIAIAHRKNLIEQISSTVARFDLPHQIIASKDTQARSMLQHRKYGKTVVDSTNQNAVASLDSLLSWYKRGKLKLDTKMPYYIFVDEGHHAADNNKWAKLKEIFPNARFIGFTATPCRLDACSLHIDDGGLYHEIVQAPSLKENSIKWLIENGYLSDFVVYSVPPDIELWKLLVNYYYNADAKKQDFANKLVPACGKIVEEWQRLVNGKKTLVFAPTIENAEFLAKKYQEAKVSCTYIASSLGSNDVARRIDAFRRGDITVLISIDMVSEGFDLPEIEAIQMLRPTASLGLYRQMIGRVLRPAPDKKKAIILDHVNNVMRHGMPDTPILWDIRGEPITQNRVFEMTCQDINGIDGCDAMTSIYRKYCPNCGMKNRYFDRPEDIKDVTDKTRHLLADAELTEKAKQYFNKLAFEQRLDSEVLSKNWSFGCDTLGKALDKMFEWFIDNLKDSGLSYRQINQFTQVKDGAAIKPLLMQNFKMSDTAVKNPQKCKQVFEQWLKSH